MDALAGKVSVKRFSGKQHKLCIVLTIFGNESVYDGHFLSDLIVTEIGGEQQQ